MRGTHIQNTASIGRRRAQTLRRASRSNKPLIWFVGHKRSCQKKPGVGVQVDPHSADVLARPGHTGLEVQSMSWVCDQLACNKRPLASSPQVPQTGGRRQPPDHLFPRRLVPPAAPLPRLTAVAARCAKAHTLASTSTRGAPLVPDARAARTSGIGRHPRCRHPAALVPL